VTNNLQSLPIGYSLAGYQLEDVLGQGGFGITYLAVDISLNNKVAIKEYYPREFAVRDRTRTIHAAGSKDDQDTFSWGLKRFLEEARILAKFDHPSIIPVRRFFEANGTAYLVMEYCDGKPLDDFLKRYGTLTAAQIERFLPPLLDALEQLHGAMILHRDIKPANIFIRDNSIPVLIDFGAARQKMAGHSRSVTSLATPGYAAFEQYSTHGKQGPWTDIYGLGATLYRAMTGIKPQDSPDRILEDRLEPVSIKAAGKYPENLLAAVDAAIAVKPAQRPQRVSEWRLMIQQGGVVAPVAVPVSMPADPILRSTTHTCSPVGGSSSPLTRSNKPISSEYKADVRAASDVSFFGSILEGISPTFKLVFIVGIIVLSIGSLASIVKNKGEGGSEQPKKDGVVSKVRRAFDGNKNNNSIQLYREAAEQGDAVAQYNLGVTYSNGMGVAKNQDEALYWYNEAAKQGYAAAQNNLGVMYDNGVGVAQDRAEAGRLFSLAAEQGNAISQFNLGLMYEFGYGYSKTVNYPMAKYWYSKAAEQGNTDAIITLKRYR
jgi:serine/threonine protein kinase